MWNQGKVGIVPADANDVVPATGSMSALVRVPNDLRLFGAEFAWQALSGSATSGYRLSNPSTYAHY